MEDAEVTPIFLPESTRKIQCSLTQRKSGGYQDLEIKCAVWQVHVKMPLRHPSEDGPCRIAAQERSGLERFTWELVVHWKLWLCSELTYKQHSTWYITWASNAEGFNL